MKIGVLQNISRWLAANASLTVIAVAVLTFFVPDLFGWVRGNTQTVILGIIMLTMGLTLTTQDFRILARRPFDIFIGACAQFLIMPCVAYLLVHVFRLEPALALGILLVYVSPSEDGLKIVFKANPDYPHNLICQQWEMAERIGVLQWVDDQCKDSTRLSFLTTPDDVLYCDEKELFNH